MRKINGRYSIEKEIKNEEVITSYSIKDQMLRKKFVLCILKNSNKYEECLNYLLRNFRSIRNLNFENMLNLIDATPIFNIDGVKIQKAKYAYIIENYDYRFDVRQYLKNIDINTKINIFIKICEAVNTLNINGYIFKDLNLSNIKYIEVKNDVVNLKLDNILEEELKKIILSNTELKNELYPFNIQDGKDSDFNLDNIEEIYGIFKDMFSEHDITSGIVELMEINKFFLYMHSSNKICTISNFIGHINNTLNRNYKICEESNVDKLKTDLDIIGREEEVQIIEKNFSNIMSNKKSSSIICFLGDNGTGKTRLLDEIHYIIQNKYSRTVLRFDDNRYLTKSDKDLIKENFEKEFDNTIIQKYDNYISKFIDYIIDKSSENEIELYKVINRFTQCIIEYARQKPIIILIDDLERQPQIIKLFFKYICSEEKRIENVMLVFTTNQSIWKEEDYDYFEYIKNKSGCEYYTLNYFNQYNTKKIISNIFNYSREINTLSLKVYEETLGNPQYIISLVNELYNKKNISYDYNHMKWKINENVKHFPIPKEIDEKTNRLVKNIGENHIKVLKKLSIFTISLPEDLIFKYIIKDDMSKKHYYELKEKHFITDKISDKGFLIGFGNDLLKNVLYTKINDDAKKKMHFKASSFLEKELENDSAYFKELFRHLLRINDKEKLYFYSKKYAYDKEKNGDTLEAIEYYKYALKYSNIESKCEIAVNIAKLYENISEHNKSMEYYKLAYRYSVTLNNLEISIYTELSMIIIIMNQEKKYGQEIEIQLKNIRSRLNNIDYKTGEIYYYHALMTLKRMQHHYDEILYYGNIALKLYDDNEKVDNAFGWIFNSLSWVYIRRNEIDKAKECALKSIKVFKENNNKNGYLFSEDMLINIELDETNNYTETIKKFSEMAKIAYKEGMIKREITALINIARIYYLVKDYKMCEKYFLKGLERQRQAQNDSYSILIYSGLCRLYLITEKIENAIKYHKLSQTSFINQSSNPYEFIRYRITEYYYNSYFYNYEKAYENIKYIYKVLSVNDNQRSIYFICIYYLFIMRKSKKIQEVSSIYNFFEDYLNKLTCNEEIKLKLWYKSIIIILKKGYIDFAKELFNKNKKMPINYDSEAYYILIEFIFAPKENYGYLINKALRVCSFNIEKRIKIELYKIIADKYIEMNCYDLAVTYYYEALNNHYDNYIKLSKEDAVIYINNSGFLEIYRKFVLCLNRKMNVRMNFIRFDEKITISEYETLNNQIELTHIISNNKIYSYMQKLYEKLYYNDLKDIYKVFSRFDDGILNNLENVIKYLARITLSDKALLLSTDSDGNRKVICNYRVSNVSKFQNLLNIVNDTQEKVNLFTSKDIEANKDEFKENNIRAFVYMKLRNNDLYLNGGNKVNSVLILAASNSIYNINEKSKQLINQFEPFLIFLLEKYNLTINSRLDKLTGCYNRKYFEENLIMAIESLKYSSDAFGIIMFDIDNFKGINDKFGHQTGDEVLIKLIKEVSKTVSKNEVIGRYGGEEFLILVPNTNKEKLLSLSERIRKNVEDAKLLGDKRKVTISIGVFLSEDKVSNGDEAIGKVDQALYKSKNTGKNKVTFWDKECNKSNITNNDTIFNSSSRDYKVGLIIADIVNIIKENCSNTERILVFIKEILHTIQCEAAAALIIDNSNIINEFIVDKEGNEIIDNNIINKIFVDKVINTKKSMNLIDWNNIIYDDDKIPDWNSLCITPVIFNGQIIAVLYLTQRISVREFNNDDMILLNSLGQLSIPIFYNN